MADPKSRGLPNILPSAGPQCPWPIHGQWSVAVIHQGQPSQQGPCWIVREGRVQSSTRIQRCHCWKPRPFPRAQMVPTPSPGTGRKKSGSSFPGSHWLERGHVVCVVLQQQRGTGILDHSRTSHICLTWSLISRPCQSHFIGGCQKEPYKTHL